ncbi:ABC transporter permease [Acidisoma cellulosilytica]|uniref:Autoinducer 2 import system permease protein LsrD n=1 Tax=Acidisoma cellulosilyticum TaxID=2802395 RepID=A0A963Z3Z9_9PROT|nr:ABC transporter permease [Acidisoma cellulosilyticum]MCB8881502.1 ABC transporter permease [Acidisoma cellulosilyticum]
MKVDAIPQVRSLVTKSGRGSKPRLSDSIARYAIYIFLVLLLILSGIAAPSFLSQQNLSNLVLQTVPLAIVVIGQAIVIMTGGLDLSVASVMATAAVAGTCFAGGVGAVIEILVVSLFIGGATGLVNGLLVAKRQVSPFLATLASMIVLQGLRFAWTKGAPSGGLPPILRVVGSGTWHGIPVNLAVLAVLAVAACFIVHFTLLGRRFMITGGNQVTARLLGYPVDRIIIGSYVASGLLAAIAGVVLGGYAEIVDNQVGRGFELDSIVAAVIGGVALSGGRGTIPGALAGAAVLMLAANAVLLLGLPIQFQIVLKGVVIVLAAACYVRR